MLFSRRLVLLVLAFLLLTFLFYAFSSSRSVSLAETLHDEESTLDTEDIAVKTAKMKKTRKIKQTEAVVDEQQAPFTHSITRYGSVDSSSSSVFEVGTSSTELGLKNVVVVAEVMGKPGFKMALPDYTHLKHWIKEAVAGKKIDVGEYLDYQEMFRKKLFPEDAIMMDVGCNHGLSALPVVALGHKVICFEPIPVNVEKLLQSRFFNKFENLMTVVHAAVGEKDGKIDLYSPEGREDNASINQNVANANVREKSLKIEVKMIKIDTWLLEHPEVDASKINFMKIDVQGFEFGVLKGAKEFLLKNLKTLTIQAEYAPHFIKSTGDNPISILEFMYKLGYKFMSNNVVQTPETFENFISSLGNGQTDILYKGVY